MSNFQKAIDDILRSSVEGTDPAPAPGAAGSRSFQDAIGSIIDRQMTEAPGATPGMAAGEQDLLASAAKPFEDELLIPELPEVPGLNQSAWAIQPREIERGFRQSMALTAQAVATPGMRAQVIRSLMRPIEFIADLFSEASPEDQEIANQLVANKISMMFEPEGSGLSTDDLRSELIAMRGATQGLSAGQQEGIAGDVGRAIGQNLPQMVGVAGALATGNVPTAAAIASTATIPFMAYSSGFLEDMQETDEQRALDALEGRPLTEYSVQKSRTRAEAQAIIETGVEMGGAALGAKAVARLAGYGVKTKMGQAALKPLIERGAPLVERALRTKGGQRGIDAFARIAGRTASFRNGWFGKAAGIVALSGGEEGAEEFVTAALMSPFTAAPLSEDLAQGLYGAFVGTVAGGVMGGSSVLAVGGNRALANRREAMRPETDRERVLRFTHSEALQRRTNWRQDLSDAQQATVAAALDSVDGMTQEQRGAFLTDLAARRADTQEQAERLLGERQQLDVALMGAMAIDPNSDDAIRIRDRISQIDNELRLVMTDRLIASAKHNAVAEKISDMPALMEQASPDKVLADVGTRAGRTLEQAAAPRRGKNVQRQVEALGRQVVWFRATDGKFNPGFHSMRSRGVVYLNADARPDALLATALEEVFHDIQMFQPELAEVFAEKAGLAPIYAVGAEYALRGQPESEAKARMDKAALAQVEDVVGRIGDGTLAPSQLSDAQARAGAARLEQEGAANAFAAAASAAKSGSILAPLVQFAAKRGFLGREVLAAMSVFDAVQRAAAVENVAGVKTNDATLSPLARTLLWASDMDVNFAREQQEANKFVAQQIKERAEVVKATEEEKKAAAKRSRQVGKLEKVAELARLRGALVGTTKMREAERLAMSRRFLSAAASMTTLSFRTLTPVEYLSGHRRNKATQTLTQYTLDQIANPRIEQSDGKRMRVTFEPYGIPGLDVAYMIKRVEYVDESDTPTGERYDEAVGLYSNEGDITDVIAPVMLHAISQYPEVDMRCDCYDVRRPGQAIRNGKLPTAYRQFGFVEDESQMPDGYSGWNPAYLTPPAGMTLDEYIALLEKYWKAEGWVPETDASGRITNYPGVWFAKLNLNAAERKRLRNSGLAGFTADPRRLESIAAGRTGGDAVASVAVSADGQPSQSLAEPRQADGAGDNQGNSASPQPDPDIFIGSSRRVSLVKLSLALKSELDNMSPEQKGRLLSASQWLPTAVQVKPETVAAEKKAAADAIAGAMRTVAAAEKAVQDIESRIAKTRAKLKKSKKPQDLLRAARLGRAMELASLASQADSLSAEDRALVALASEAKQAKEQKKNLEEFAVAAISVGADPSEYAPRMAAVTARLREIDKQLREWTVSDPEIELLLDAKQAVKDAEQALADTKLQTFGDILADRGILSYRLAGQRKYTVPELQGLLDSFSQSIVGWLMEYDAQNVMPKSVQEIMVRAIADDLKYAATKVGSASALEWYGRAVDQMWSESARKYKQLADPQSDDRRVFGMFLAITSQGERVANNAILTRVLYEAWVKSGRTKVVIPASFNARNAAAMIKNLEKLNVLHEHFGSWAKVEEFMLQKDKTANHNAALRKEQVKINGKTTTLAQAIGQIDDAKDDVVYMSSVLGPKIGSFYNNLHKRFDTLTADVWFTRTFIRILGGLRRPDETGVRSAIQDIATELARARAIVAEGPTAPGYADAQNILAIVPDNALSDPEALERAAFEFDKQFVRDPANRLPNGKLRPKTTAEAALVRYAKSATANAAAPDSMYMRSLMRTVMTEAISVVQNETGLSYEMADAQAALWYVEKELYARFGAAPDPAGQDYQQAMQYAMGINLESDAGNRAIAEAVAANTSSDTVREAAESGVIADNDTESMARDAEIDQEYRSTIEAIRGFDRWARLTGADLSFNRAINPMILRRVEDGSLQFMGSDDNTPVVLYHNSNDTNFEPYKVRGVVKRAGFQRGLSFSTDPANLSVFGSFQYSYYVVAERPLRIQCEGAPWDRIVLDDVPADLMRAVMNLPEAAEEAEIARELQVAKGQLMSTTDSIARAAFRAGYDAVEFVDVEEPDGPEGSFVHNEIVVSGRQNLISTATGRTLHDMDMRLWRQDPNAAPPYKYLTFIEHLGGSTGAKKMMDSHGQEWVTKQGANPAHVLNEFYYLQTMRLLGVNVPSADMDVVPVGTDGTYVTPVLITKFAENHITLGEYRQRADQSDGFINTRAFQQIQNDFVAHVLARNWDWFGLELDNALVNPDTGELLWVDLGASGAFRAQGATKPDASQAQYSAPFIRDLQSMMSYAPQGLLEQPSPRSVVSTLVRYATIFGASKDLLTSVPDAFVNNLMSTLGTLYGETPNRYPGDIAEAVVDVMADDNKRERFLSFMAQRLADQLNGVGNLDAQEIVMRFQRAETEEEILSQLPFNPSNWETNPEDFAKAVNLIRDATKDPDNVIYTALNGQTNLIIRGADARIISEVIANLVRIRARGEWQKSVQEIKGRLIPKVKEPEGIIDTTSMARDPDADAEEIAALQARVVDLQMQMRNVENVTAAQRANAARDVRLLERRIAAMSLLSEQRVGQLARLKARLQRNVELRQEAKAAAEDTVERMADKLEEAKARVRRLKDDMRAQRTATKAALEALDEAEDKTDRVANWAYAIGRNEGLVAGQVAGMQAERRANRPYRERLDIVEARLEQATKELQGARLRIKTDAKAAERAINFAHQMGMRTGLVQGMMEGRRQILRKMQKREDTLQRQLQSLRDLMDMKVLRIRQIDAAVRQIATDAASMLPTRLRGPLAVRIAKAKTIGQANRVAVEATKLAINEEVRRQLQVISALRKRMNQRGMRYGVRQQIDVLLREADAMLRQSNRRRIYAKVEGMKDASGKTFAVGVVNAVRIYAQVVEAANKAEQALLLYEADRQSFKAAQAARVARYNDLKERILQAMKGRPVLQMRDRSDQPPIQSLARRISLANSDIYTLMLELEGTMSGVINEMLVAAQDAKGAAALEHARMLSDLSVPMLGAGYSGIEDYALRNGLHGAQIADTITVTLGGEERRIPVGVAMSIAAMDDETLELFVPPTDPDAARQGLQFAGAETTLTVYPTDAEIRALRSALTPGQRGLIDAMKTALETQIRDRVMESVFLVEGDQPPVVPNYWPRVRNTEEFQGENKSVLSAHGSLVRSALTSVGFANAREGGRMPLIYRDAFQTWQRHVQVSLDMIHMAQPYRDASTVLTDPRVVEAIDRQMGRDAAQALLSLFSNGVGATARGSTNAIDRLTNNVTGAVLALSPRTAAKVLVGGTIRLASELPGDYWATGVASATLALQSPSGWAARVGEIHAYSGYFTRRHQMQMRGIISGTMSAGDRVKVMTAARGFAKSIAAAGHSVAAKNITDALNALGDATDNANMTLMAMMDMLRVMDEMIMLVAVEGRRAQVRDEGMSGDEALREAIKRAERDFRMTQNASDEFDETAFAAVNRTRGSGATWRMVFPFSSDPLKARNQIRRAWLTGQRRIGTTVAIAGNTASGAIIGAASTATILYVAKTIAALLGGADEPDDEEDKAFAESVQNIPAQIGAELIGSTFGYVGLGISSALQSVVTRRAMGQALVARPIEQASRALQEDNAAALNATKAALALLQLRGVPLYQLYRFVETQIPEGQPSPEERVREQMQRLRDRYAPDKIRERILNDARRKAKGQFRVP